MKTPESANCPQFLDNLGRLMSGGMSEAEEREFLTSIANSVDCLEMLEMEKAYKEFIVTRLERKNCSHGLIERIRNSIKEE